MMRCYYELLGVPQDVGAAELKKAYYKQSLQWHPDKNQLEQNTTSVFQEIQEAYRVLSDPQERTWYDNHRMEILQGGGKFNKGGSSNYKEERIDVFCFFKRSCFSGFDDTPKGFYSVYRKVFDDLTSEELRASSFGNRRSSSSSSTGEEQSQKGQSSSRYATFGQSDSSYSDVVAPFYQFWESFQTKKSYSWKEKYDVRQAESRPERRAMELENRRLRDAAKRKRNDEVRQLVAHVKKRDKRVDAEMERLEAANAELHLRSLNMARNARQREAERLAQAWVEELASGGVAAHWEEVFQVELARMESEIDGIALNNGLAERASAELDADASGDEDERLDGADELYCFACNKLYTSVKARENHESSKKHKKQAMLLRKVLLAEEAENGSPRTWLDQEQQLPRTDSSDEEPGAPGANMKLTKRGKKALRRRNREQQKQVVEAADEGGEEDAATPETTTTPQPLEAVPVATVEEEPGATAGRPANILCEFCSMTFSSRNQLFSHLKVTGHAKLKVVPSSNANSKATSRSSTSKSKGKKR